MTEWKERLLGRLEPVLEKPDPRPAISAYHDMPYAIFCYPPEAEFPLRIELSLLRTRLEQKGKRVTVISLADCLRQALDSELPVKDLVGAEKSVGLTAAIETVHEVLSNYIPLDQLVAQTMPGQSDPSKDVVFIVRAGSLFPMYRTSSLLEQLKGRIHVASVLFYPGEVDGAAGLRFMGVLDAEHNYRPKIF